MTADAALAPSPGLTTQAIMRRVLLALVPGIAAMAYWHGPFVLATTAVACLTALVVEAACLRLRRVPIARALRDGSALVTALLIAVAVPPLATAGSLWATVLAVTVALALGKHAYGGLGQNVFNPAMVGYAFALIALPGAFAVWPQADGVTGATVLDSLKHREGLTIAEFASHPAMGTLGGQGAEWQSAAFLAGGMALVAMRIVPVRVPLAVLIGVALPALAFYDGGSSASKGGVLFHLFSGGLMLAAFFIATDPVTQPTSARAQWAYGLTIGAMTFAVRAFGSHPDGIAFAVLLANAATPWLDRRWPR